MAAVWNIKRQPHGKFVTCQRPIVVQMEVTQGAVAHFKGKLYIKDMNPLFGTGSWEDTGVVVNAYGDEQSEFFECNLAEYCRNYFLEVKAFYNSNWCQNFNTMVAREFKVDFYPVTIDLSGNLVELPSDIKTTNQFFVVPANTMARESTSSVNDNVRLDKFVIGGDNDSTVPVGSSDNNSVLSNMPDYNIIDVSQGFWFYHNTLQHEVSQLTSEVEFVNDSGQSISFNTGSTGYAAVYLHPYMIDFIQTLASGTTSNFVTDLVGNVTSETISVTYKYKNSSGQVVRFSPTKHYIYKNGMPCESTTFVFRNMRGGFDFFTATGEEDVSVELSGSEFDRHTDFNLNINDFGLKRGQHNMTNLWNDRKELTTIFSQPISKEYAIWLDELIMSPQVWIIKDIKDYQEGDNNLFNMPYQNKGLVAINILKGSYKLHNSENGRHFIEFKYTLSENTITQKM